MFANTGSESRLKVDQEVRLRMISITCSNCSSGVLSIKHRIQCIGAATNVYVFNRTAEGMQDDASPASFSEGLKNAILNLKLSNGVTYYPETGFKSLLVGTSKKVYCDKCNLFVVAEGHAERCNFSSRGANTDLRTGATTRWTTERRKAWIGDAIHKLDIRMAALIRGIPDIGKSNFENSYTDAVSQAKYMKEFESNSVPNINMSDHSISTMFEARYHTEFRRSYLSRKFGLATATIIMSSAEDSYDSDVFNSMDSTTE